MKTRFKNRKITYLIIIYFFACSLFADKINVTTNKEASRFLTQATFGPTKSEIDKLKALATYEKWIDEQIKMPASKLTPKLREIKLSIENDDSIERKILREYNRQAVWWDTVLHAEDQLRQRMAYALSEILVTGFTQGFSNREIERTIYYDILVEKAFSSYKEILVHVSKNPIMGKYLSMLNNKKADPENNTHPDENYAREIMQLFTIGLVELNKDGTSKVIENQEVPTYTQDDIENLARAFTGWKLDNKSFEVPMVCKEEDHDLEEKILIGQNISGQDESLSVCEQDLINAIEILYSHPNTSVFISKQLIQKFVTSNPTKEYVEDITNIFLEEDGNLGEVIKAILLHDEARKERDLQTDNFGKFKEPIIKLVGFYRSTNPSNNQEKISSFFSILGQTYLDSPSVFNYFRPNYKVDNSIELLTPELQLATDDYSAKTSNMYFNKSLNTNCENSNSLCINLNEEQFLWIKEDVDKFLDYYDLLLFSGNMSEGLRNKIKLYLELNPYPEEGTQEYEEKEKNITRRRVGHALYFMTNSAEQSFQQ